MLFRSDRLLADDEALRANAFTVHSLLVLASWHRVFVENATTRGTASSPVMVSR